MYWRYFLLQAMLFACVWGGASPAFAGPKTQAKQPEKAQTLEEQLAGLKKRDPEVRDLGDWTRLVEKAERVGTADALFVAGQASGRIFEKRDSRVALLRAVSLYERLARKYPRAAITDDALLALGDLRRSGLDDDTAARSAYFQIIDRYPDSNSAAPARDRVDGAKATKSSEKLPGKTSKESVTNEPKQGERSERKTEEVKPTVEPSPYFRNVEGETVYSKEIVRKRPLVVIDPGHGGDDDGAHGVENSMEKDLVLVVSQMVDELLRERLRAQTILTRTSDRTVPLAERTKIANDNEADLFISIHANASEYKTGSGVETYYLDNTKDKASLKLAERENAAVSFGGSSANQDVTFMMSELIQNAKLDDSISLAHHIQKQIVSTLGRYYQGVNDLGVKKAPFYVLVGAHMPCVLVELSFIDHPVEGRRLAEKRYQRLLAQAIFEGARDFFQKRQ